MNGSKKKETKNEYRERKTKEKKEVEGKTDVNKRKQKGGNKKTIPPPPKKKKKNRQTHFKLKQYSFCYKFYSANKHFL